jgi:glucose-1-phosphatase
MSPSGQRSGSPSQRCPRREQAPGAPAARGRKSSRRVRRIRREVPHTVDETTVGGRFPGCAVTLHAMITSVTDASMRPGSVDALLFDLGGVVVDIDFRRCFRRWADTSGTDIELIASRFSFDAAYEQHERGAMDIADYFHQVRLALGVDLSDNELLEGWNDIYVGVVPGIGPLLSAAAAKFPLYAFTNSNPTHQTVWSKRFASDLEVFAATFVSCDVGQRKPDRLAFDAVTAMVEMPASRILFFDDLAENTAGALDAGLQAVHVSTTSSVASALAQLGVHVPDIGCQEPSD